MPKTKTSVVDHFYFDLKRSPAGPGPQQKKVQQQPTQLTHYITIRPQKITLHMSNVHQ